MVSEARTAGMDEKGRRSTALGDVLERPTASDGDPPHSRHEARQRGSA
jgi:hypothetical protein